MMMMIITKTITKATVTITSSMQQTQALLYTAIDVFNRTRTNTTTIFYILNDRLIFNQYF